MDLTPNDKNIEKEPCLFLCEICDYTTGYKKDYNRHLLSKKHKKKEAENEPENTTCIYSCDTCDFKTIYKYNYSAHMSSKKHLYNSNLNNSSNQCVICKKQYSSQKNLWRHKKRCKAGTDTTEQKNRESDSDIEDDNYTDSDSEDKLEYSGDNTQKLSTDAQVANGFTMTPEMFIHMYKQNNEFQMLMLEQQKYMLDKIGSMGNNSNNNSVNSINTANCNNKTFNIQFFLNEHCKNAIDINEFVRTLDYSTKNLESNMRLGYTGGISKMITDKIRSTPVEERPLHCCDEKREKLYIRNNGEWITGNDSRDKIQSVIADIANNNYRTFQQWVRENPSCLTLDTPAYEKYTAIYNGVFGSRTDDEEVKHVKKILSNIINDIVIEKDKYLV